MLFLLPRLVVAVKQFIYDVRNLIEKADKVTTRRDSIAQNYLILQRYHIVSNKKDLTERVCLYYKTYPARE